jgi:predicted transcriptional regulator
MLKLIRINDEGSFIDDGCRISDVTLDQINLDYKSDLTFRISVTEQAENKRGLTIFGKIFGNYSQDLLARVLYDVKQD